MIGLDTKISIKLIFKSLKKKERERQFISVNYVLCKLNNNVNIGNCNFIIFS